MGEIFRANFFSEFFETIEHGGPCAAPPYLSLRRGALPSCRHGKLKPDHISSTPRPLSASPTKLPACSRAAMRLDHHRPDLACCLPPQNKDTPP